MYIVCNKRYSSQPQLRWAAYFYLRYWMYVPIRVTAPPVLRAPPRRLLLPLVQQEWDGMGGWDDKPA